MNKKQKEKLIVVGFWKRLLSDILDSIILGLFGAAIAFGFRGQLNQVGENGFWIGLIITFLYTGILQSGIGKGQSLAKKALKIQVLRKDGSYLSLPRSFLRYLIVALLFYNSWIGLSLISVFPALNNNTIITFYNYAIFVLFIGTIFLVAFHPLKRGLHDLLADSIVVRKDEYSQEEIQKLENPKKAKFAYGLVAIISILIIAGASYFAKTQNFASPEIVQELTDLSREIDSKTSFDNVGVFHNIFTDTAGKQTTGLIVYAFQLQKKFDDKEFTFGEVKKTVDIVKNYSHINECQYINISVRTGFNIGISHLTYNQGFPFDAEGNVLELNKNKSEKVGQASSP
ncbi:MAG: RDD family protein [Candidatus Omnitrophica bacterium]|nr:RDD family protein [Candidatus Omnitrophota bacterium]